MDKMEKITTGDGTITYRSEIFGEPYHSKSGALEEAQKKYVEPCKIKPGMKILDIGFGLGYNVYAAIKRTKDLEVISLEKDIRSEIQEINIDREYDIIKEAAQKLVYNKNKLIIKIIQGDATNTIKKINEKFDAVFLDPFSPPKNPELWTESFFKEIFRRMNRGAILATYSCARKVRDNLILAGFKVEDGPTIGRRSPSTIACKV